MLSCPESADIVSHQGFPLVHLDFLHIFLIQVSPAAAGPKDYFNITY